MIKVFLESIVNLEECRRLLLAQDYRHDVSIK